MPAELVKRYFAECHRLLDKAERSQTDCIRQAGKVIAGAIAQGGTLHIFGTGHSHMLAEELYVRAGGLVCASAILEPDLMLHEDPARATELEGQEGLAGEILVRHELWAGDVLIVVSNSGRNPVPIEMALLARERGLVVIALTSLAHSQAVTSRHSSGWRLFEVADVVLDNGGQVGDATLEVEGLPTKVCPSSTVIGAAILNAVVAATIEELLAKGIVPPVLVSSNVDPQG
ncbi:SIS domain-containing protein [Candidatus Hakubella thermalkaliphila]|uniref:SIS domain-containing protein n=1 Tax=Candidatus Hakubella thermalkaliphila TaxID=2754717 RepID=A0A6V8QBN7_9ACTN|nr:SIS domain-containing protein [Candidatus Hakubella thermalkaliphila]GFP26742.1 hypothetical protein HKBW3S33_00157 [Candidatus Hakubella thermalkaliphila]GFP41810.1 hypothetical protein HKBW3C_00937 [Candidatus Hakubella thermalkaliphila]